MACALASRGHAIEVVCAAHPWDRPVTDARVRVTPVRYTPPGIAPNTFYGAGAPDQLMRGDPIAWLGALTFPAALGTEAGRALADCDALISHFIVPCGVIGGLIRGDRRHLAIAHGSDAQLFARLPGALQRAILHRTTAFQLTSAAHLHRLHPSVQRDPRVAIEPMGFSPHAPLTPESRARVRAELGIGAEPLVLAVARLVRVKGIDVLVAAAAQCGDAIRVVVAGDGPERAQLERASAACGARVQFVGVVDGTRRDALLDAADIFVAPSLELEDGRTDGAPVAVLEAMHARLAVIATRTGGLPALLGDAGMLVDANDAGALARAIRELCLNPERRRELGQRARLRAAPHRWECAIERIESALEARQFPGPRTQSQ